MNVRYLVGALALVLGAGISGYWLGERHLDDAVVSRNQIRDPAPIPLEAVHPSTGESGDLLVIETVVLEPPDNLVSTDERIFRKRPWFFPDTEVNDLQALWSRSLLEPSQLEWFADTNHWGFTGAAILLTPPDEVIRSLSPESRETIYSVLARHEENVLHYHAYVFPKEFVDELFNQSGLDNSVVQEVRGLLYFQGNRALFSDAALFRNRLSSEEQKRLLKMLSRSKSLKVSVRIDEETDVGGLLKEWGSTSEMAEIIPLLQAMKRVEGGEFLDLSYLLPAFARERLYRYPDPSSNNLEAITDCMWTALNFSHPTVEDRFIHVPYRNRYLREHYEEVQSAPGFGDIVTWEGANDYIAHACVYLIDDIVFTKNGSSATAPWVLLKLEEVDPVYNSSPDIQRKLYRLKSQPGS